jgi:ribosomal protein S17
MKKSLWLCGLLALLVAPSLSLTAAPAAAPATAGVLTGKVAETMNAATYTYVLVDTGAKKAWAAAPQFAVKVGDTVTIADAMPMTNYQSKTLNRTFDVVYFSGNVQVNGKAAVATPAPAAPAGPNLSGIARAEGGQTVAEILTGKTKFAGKTITVRARVVKFNAQILGKNWLHIRDGSGAEGTNDLTVTTAANVKVGDLVLVTGKLSADRDFGSGYKYPLIVEDATVVAQ